MSVLNKYRARFGLHEHVGVSGILLAMDRELFKASWERAMLLAAMTDCGGGEQPAFEAWAKSQGYDMSEHPLHWLFLDPKTYAARQGWKGALEYMRAAEKANK